VAEWARPSYFGRVLSLDVGCGPKKRPGSIGLDVVALDGVDHVLDFDADPLPFEDGTVDSIFSSHCLEHLADPVRIMREMSRVARHGARLELWTPYPFHSAAFVFGHRSLFTEFQYQHMSFHEPAYWTKQLGARWIVREIVLSIPGETITELESHGVDLAFAVRYFKDVVLEMGAFVEIDKSGTVAPHEPQMLIASGRVPDGRRPLEAPKKRPLARLRGLLK
jgi:SAM-dependent methyltransferase